MSIQAVSWALEQIAPMAPKFILVCLANYADENGECWPSIKTMARNAGCGERSVYRYLDELMELGLIEKQEQTGKNGGRTASRYKLIKEKPTAKLADTPLCQSDQPPIWHTPSANVGIPPLPLVAVHIDEPSIEPSIEAAAATPARTRAHVHPAVEKVIAEVNHPHLDLSKSPNLLFGGATLTHWIEEGIDLDETIIPAITAQMSRHRGGPVQQWNYFRGAVFDAHRIRMEAAKPIDFGESNEPAFSAPAPARSAPQRRGPVPISDVFLQAEHRAREAERRRRGSVSDWSADESGGAHEGVSGGAALLTAS